MTNPQIKVQDIKEEIACTKYELNSTKELLYAIREKNSHYVATELPPIDKVNQRIIEKRVEELQQKLARLELSQSTISSSDKLIPFTNQVDTLEAVLSTQAPTYSILNAPAGYGKTYLLHEIKRRFTEKSWQSIYILASQNHTLQNLIDSLFVFFDEQTSPSSELEVQASELVTALKSRKKNQVESYSPIKGFAVLIDFDKTPPEKDVIEELAKFLEMVGTILDKRRKENEIFESTRDSFRVVLAGRYLTEEKQSGGAPLSFSKSYKLRTLALFEYDVVYDATSDYLANFDKSEEKSIPAHILFLTGGHPGAMAELLKIYQDSSRNPKNFLNYYSGVIDSTMDDVIDQVRDNVPKKLQRTMDRLSPCRSFNTSLIKYFMDDSNNILSAESPVTLADKLTTSHLLERKGGFLKNSITRRLLAKRLKKVEPTTFNRICKTLINFYCTALKNPKTDTPYNIAKELLYQKLQITSQPLHSHKSIDIENLNKSFFKSVDECLIYLVRNRETTTAIDMIDSFKDTIRNDLEFKFSLNYFLKEDEFTEAPYQQLQNTIKEFREKTLTGSK